MTFFLKVESEFGKLPFFDEQPQGTHDKNTEVFNIDIGSDFIILLSLP
jgi:hypothetical protein